MDLERNLEGLRRKITYDDSLRFPNDGRRYEILDGDFVVTPAPLGLHQWAARAFFRALDGYTHSHGLGDVYFAPVDVTLDDATVLTPDLLFISSQHASRFGEFGVIGPPDLVVEILSSYTAHRDRGAKMKLYARYGIDRYWIVDPDARFLEIYARRNDIYEQLGAYGADAVVHCDAPAGLELHLADVWAD